MRELIRDAGLLVLLLPFVLVGLVWFWFWINDDLR
jgi:hypothetical protein